MYVCFFGYKNTYKLSMFCKILKTKISIVKNYSADYQLITNVKKAIFSIRSKRHFL